MTIITLGAPGAPVAADAPAPAAADPQTTAAIDPDEADPARSAPPADTSARKYVPSPAQAAAPAEAAQAQAGAVAQADATEKVIVVGYGAMKKRDVTGSVSVIDSRELRKAHTSSVAQALQGKAAGVTITHNSGQPGKPMQVRVRGMGSINNSDPLYVVDGMPTANIEYLNPQDIESMTVLKDASSTSIYGARGANGVILITTKKGVPGLANVSYSSSFGTSAPWKSPDLVSASEWVNLRNTAVRNSGDTSSANLLPAPANAAGTDWWSEVTREDAVSRSHNFSVLQGDRNLNYYLSGGLSDDQGIVRGSDSRKITVRANVQSRVKSWLNIGSNVGYANQKTNIADESDEWNSTLITAISMDPVTPVRDSSGNFSSSGGSGIKNPAGIVAHNNNHVESNRLKGNVFASVKPLNSVELKSNYGLDLVHSDSSVFKPAYFISGADNRGNAEVRRENARQVNWVWENTASWDKGFGADHFVRLLAGVTAEENNWENMVAVNTATPSNDPTQRYLSATQSRSAHVEGNAVSSTLLSYLGRVNYDYATRYFANAALRVDGSSRFGPENRWGVFPSVGAAWDVSKEKFMAGVKHLDYLKLRAGWGVIGNQNIEDYLYTTTTKANQGYPFGGQVGAGATFTSSGNPGIQWEEQESRNLGLDFNLFGSALEVTTDFYVKNTSKMLLRVAIPSQAGLQTAPMVNGGDVENQGFDLGLAYRREFGRLSAKLGGNFAMYRNEVTSLGADGNVIAAVPFRNLGYVNQSEVGRPIASFYGYKTDGLFQDTLQVAAFKDKDGNLVQPDARPGDIRYLDADRDGEWDQGYLGSPHPDFTYGFSLDLGHRSRWGEVDFHLFFQGVQGNEIFNGTRYYTDQTTGFFNMDRKMLGAWSEANKHNDVTRPRLNSGDANNTRISDRYIEDGSYLRLKTMKLGYTLPKLVNTAFGLAAVRLFTGATNLLTVTGYSGFDPEVGTGRFSSSVPSDDANYASGLDIGIDRANYPQPRSFFTGIEISL